MNSEISIAILNMLSENPTKRMKRNNLTLAAYGKQAEDIELEENNRLVDILVELETKGYIDFIKDIGHLGIVLPGSAQITPDGMNYLKRW